MVVSTTPTERSTMANSPVYAGVRTAILGHIIAPGTKLPEDELSKIYSVSRTIVRPALQALAHDRLVVLEPNRGAFVAKPSKRQAREVFEARALLEPKVAAMAAGVARKPDIARLKKHLKQEHQAIRQGDDSGALVLSAQFHVSIAEIAGQSIFTEYVRDLCSRSSLVIALYWQRRDTTCECHAHNALVDAIAQNQPADAAELMNSHLVDLLSGLDLRERQVEERALSDLLG